MRDAVYLQHRAHAEARFATMQPVPGSAEVHVSPSGRFELGVVQYDDGTNGWTYSRGGVRRVGEDPVIADVRRNLGSFWFAWVAHADGEYLLCGEDYQGYNVIELETGREAFTFPPEAADGRGFCWTNVHPSPEGDVLAVEGCVWGGPYELRFFDFAEPLVSPLPELGRVEDYEEAEMWTADGSFWFGTLENLRTWRRPDLSDGAYGWRVHRRGDGLSSYLDVAEGDPAALAPAVAAFWRRLLDGTAALAPEWNVLYVSVWYTSGRVLGYANRALPEGPGVRHDRRGEPLYVALHSDYVLDRNDAIGDALDDEELPDDEGLTDEDAAAAWAALAAEVHGAVRAALAEPSVAERFGALVAARGLRAFLFDYEGEDGAAEL
ncbi:MAG TPA: hypothetical protein VK610_09000, partial [Rhodothermales bacterium]|nr:hypothetical protein [Rhodothermales bacterium]